MPARIDLAAIDRTQFHVTPHVLEGIGPVVTVVPHKTKHTWALDELHLRSLLTDPNGVVLSAGFPKFFNLGEEATHDAAFAEALAAGRVSFTEKIDGSLLIIDRIAGRMHCRTRGTERLRDGFAVSIPPLLAQYPDLERLVTIGADPIVARASLLFEYTSPVHRIVCPVDAPALTLLGYVDKATLTPGWDPDVLARLSRQTGIPVAPTHVLPTEQGALVAEIRRWTGREGVVARFVAADGTPQLLKLKSDWYRTLHALRFGMSERRAAKLCYLLGVTAMEDVRRGFAQLGVDFEVCEHLIPSLTTYFARRTETWATCTALLAVCERARTAAAGNRKAFVDAVRAHITTTLPRADHAAWFGIALAWLDGKEESVRRTVEALALGESPRALLLWDRGRDAEIARTLAAAAMVAEE